MSIFLERQQVKKRRNLAKRIRAMERILFSLAVVFGGVALLYGVYLLIVFGPLFSVRDIYVDGSLNYITKEEAINLAGVSVGQNLFGYDARLGHENLSKHPWVREAVVGRRPPHTIWIHVNEYVPVAVVLNKGSAFYVDEEGTVFKNVEAGEPGDFLVISGIDSEGEVSGESLKQAFELVSVYNNSSAGELWGISEVHVEKDTGFSIISEKGPVEILIGQNSFLEKINLLDQFFAAILRKSGNIRYVLANEGDRITVGYRNMVMGEEKTKT